MVSRKIKEALEIICRKLKGKGINWVLVGSTNLALQGVDVTAHDIDILTDKGGAFLVGKLLEDYEIRRVKYKKSEKFSSYFGQFKVRGVKVEVMGDLKIKHLDEMWYQKPLIKKTIKIDEIEVPVNPLVEALKGYTASGRVEKVRKIEEALRR